jgi:hypothetical protein
MRSTCWPALGELCIGEASTPRLDDVMEKSCSSMQISSGSDMRTLANASIRYSPPDIVSAC